MTYLGAYLFKFDDLGVDFHQTKVNKYIYDILKLFGGQGQTSKPFLGLVKLEKASNVVHAFFFRLRFLHQIIQVKTQTTQLLYS